jgi:ketosteroid isomerase-like protein
MTIDAQPIHLCAARIRRPARHRPSPQAWRIASLAMFVAIAMPAAVPAAEPKAAAPTTMPQPGSEECVVWNRELSFADSIARHDSAAFSEHLRVGVVFGVSRVHQTRGREAVTAAWRGIVEGKTLTVEWYPTRVAIGDVGNIAWSSGPSLFITDPGSDKATYSLGSYHSVWARDADGVWRVLFDDGVEGKNVGAAEVAAFRQARSRPCGK